MLRFFLREELHPRRAAACTLATACLVFALGNLLVWHYQRTLATHIQALFARQLERARESGAALLVLGDSVPGYAVDQEVLGHESGLPSLNLSLTSTFNAYGDFRLLHEHLKMGQRPEAVVLVHAPHTVFSDVRPSVAVGIPYALEDVWRNVLLGHRDPRLAAKILFAKLCPLYRWKPDLERVARTHLLPLLPLSLKYEKEPLTPAKLKDFWQRTSWHSLDQLPRDLAKQRGQFREFGYLPPPRRPPLAEQTTDTKIRGHQFHAEWLSYREKDNSNEPVTLSLADNSGADDREVSFDTLYWLDRFHALARQHGIPIFVALGPYEEYFQYGHRNRLAAYREFIGEYAAARPGMYVIEDRHYPMPAQAMLDSHHILTDQGRATYTRHLAEKWHEARSPRLATKRHGSTVE